MKSVRALVTLCACLIATAASAVELPIKGVFGMDANDCKAAKEENEGGYVAFEGASVGHGGQGGCDFTRVQKSGTNTFTLTGTCFGLEGPKRAMQRVKLVVKSASEIEYDGADYKRCPP